MPRLSVQRLFDDRSARLRLSWVAGAAGAGREITGEMLTRPGIGIIGHMNLIHPLMVQVVGRREAEYFAGLEAAAREQTAQRLCGGETVCVLVCDGIPAPEVLQRAAERAGTPLIGSTEPSQQVINVLRPYLQGELGSVMQLHGVFLDVLEIGVLITGESSVGKSELALELISRGHGLVADDVVELQQIGPETVSGRCPPMLRDFLEVRGLGVLNVREMFGDTAVKRNKYLRLIVQLAGLEVLNEGDALQRLSGVTGYRTVLDVEIPQITLPVAPGRNLAVLVEAAVRHHLLRSKGIDPAQTFMDRQAHQMRRQAPW